MSDMANDIIDKFIETDESYVLTKEEMNYLKNDEQAVMDYYLKQSSKPEKAETNHVKKVTAKIVTNGNCCICGKPLDSEFFVCKECVPQLKKEIIEE